MSIHKISLPAKDFTGFRETEDLVLEMSHNTITDDEEDVHR